MEKDNGISQNDPQRDGYICMEGPVLTAYQSSPPKKGDNFLFTKVAFPHFWKWEVSYRKQF